MQFLISNWEYVLIVVLAIDKIVALTPNTWDDLIWTSVKKTIMKVVKKGLKRLLSYLQILKGH